MDRGIDESEFCIDAPGIVFQFLFERPFGESVVASYCSRVLDIGAGAAPLDMGEAQTGSDIDFVDEVGAKGHGPFFRASSGADCVLLIHVTLGDGAVIVNPERVLKLVDEIGLPSRMDIVGVVVVEVVASIDKGVEEIVDAVDSLEIGVDERAGRVQASEIGAIVMVVCAGETQGEMHVSQRFVVAARHSKDVSEVRDAHFCESFAMAFSVIACCVEIVLDSGGEGDLAAAVEPESCGVDAQSGEVAAHGSCGAPHGHAASSAFVEGLGIGYGIIHSLGECLDRDNEEEGQGKYGFFHRCVHK